MIYIKHNHTKGGMRSHVYMAWDSMIRRCTSPSHRQYKDYGGRGIGVCRRWLEFENFLADMGEPGPGLTLERKRNNRGYSPSNCRWASPAEQARNRRNNKLTMAKARQIRANTDSSRKAALLFDVTSSMIRLIRQNKRWKE